MSNLPKQTGSEECAHSTDFFTREKIATKIKQIRAKYRKALDAGQKSGGGRIVATFYDLCSEIWSWSTVTESIQAGLETEESLKAPADEDMDPIERASKENNDVELAEEEDFDNEAITVISATFSITSSATSSVTPIQQNLLLTYTPIQSYSTVKAVIKRQEDKLLERKCRKC